MPRSDVGQPGAEERAEGMEGRAGLPVPQQDLPGRDRGFSDAGGAEGDRAELRRLGRAAVERAHRKHLEQLELGPDGVDTGEQSAGEVSRLFAEFRERKLDELRRDGWDKDRDG